MSGTHPTTVIVGAGQAGARVAKAMRDAGYTGTIRLLGAEAHLPYERPLLSKAFLKDPATPVPFVLPPAAYQELDIDLRTNCEVDAIDRVSRTVRARDGEIFSYDRLVLATGSCLRPLVISGYPAHKILNLRTLDDSFAIERMLGGHPSVAIVGGGFIGLEVAATLAARGCAVSVIELGDRLLPRLACPEASEMVLEHHRASGTDVRLARRVTRGGEDWLELDDGSRVQADFVVAGIGVLPNTALAEAAGLDVSDGLVVDEFGRTSDPAIYGAGDVTRHFNPLLGRFLRLESWQNANLQAEAAGRAIAGVLSPYSEIPWLWSDHGTLNLQMAGSPERVDRVIVRRGPEQEDGISVFQLCDDAVVGGLTINRGKDMTLIRRMLAAGGLSESPELLADANVPLRRFLPARAAA